jgi:hypothetical protein
MEERFHHTLRDKVRGNIVTDCNLLGTPGPGAYILHSEFGTLKSNLTLDE